MAIMWHGGNRWEGGPEIRAAKRGRAEWGPGIYGTTNYFRASQYAKGGKVVQLVEFKPRLYLDETAIGLNTLTEFVKAKAPKSKHADIIGTLERAAGRNKTDGLALIGDGDMVRSGVIVNMWVNTDLSHGQRGPALSSFLTDLGIDGHAELSSGLDGNPEHWVVIFNPKAITRHEVMLAKEVDESTWYLPDPVADRDLTIKGYMQQILGAEDEQPSTKAAMRMG